jgi:hypothetical protein
MAEGALGISTGIGQGEAQIIKPFQSPVTAQQYGSVMAAQQKAQQDAAAKKAKAAASIADFQFKGLPQHAELFAKGYDDVVNYAIENIDDPLIEFKLKQRMSDLNTKANMSADLKANLQKQADFVQQGQGKNYYLGFDEAVKEVVTPIDYTTFQDTNKFGQAIGGKANLLNGVKTVPIYDIGAAKSDLQNQISGWAKDNMQGKSWQADDKIINSFVEAELTGHPEAIVHFERVMKTDPIGAKAAGNDPYQYGFNELKKDLKAKGFTTGGNTNINIGGGSSAAISPTSAFEGSIVFGDQDDTNPKAFNTSQKTLFTTFQAKDVVIPVPEEAFSAKTIRKKGKGGAINSKVGGAAIVSTLSSPIEMFGVKIPAGTPIPDGAKPSEIYQLYVGEPLSQEDADIVDNVNGAAPNIAKGLANSLSKTTKQAFMIGLSSDGKTDSYIPFEYGYNAVRGGLSKDDVASYDAQIENFLKLAQEQGVKIPVNIRAGGGYKATTTGGTKTTSGKKTKAGAIDLSDF